MACRRLAPACRGQADLLPSDQITERMVHYLFETKAALEAVKYNTGVAYGGKVKTGPIRQFCDVVKGTFPTKKTPPGQYRFVVTAADARTANDFQFNRDAVCVPMVSSTGHGHAAIHRIHYASGEFALANIMAAIIPRDDSGLDTKYLYYYLWRFKEEKLVSLMAGTANTSLTLEKVRGMEISFPYDEDIQSQAVELLDNVILPLTNLDIASTHISPLARQSRLASLAKVFAGTQDLVSGLGPDIRMGGHDALGSTRADNAESIE